MTLRVAAKSSPQRLAKSIVHHLEEKSSATIQAVGKIAAGVTLIALTIASDTLAEKGFNLAASFKTFQSNSDEPKNGIEVLAKI